MSDPLHLTILYEEGGDGWIVSSIPEVPGVFSQGRTKEEAREMALDALAGMLELRAAEYQPQGRQLAVSRSTSSRREATRPRATPEEAWRPPTA